MVNLVKNYIENCEFIDDKLLDIGVMNHSVPNPKMGVKVYGS